MGCYTSEVNTLLLIALLKKHNIRKVIASPGTTNISFVFSVQNDPYFQVFSAVDERAAAFMACGLAEESKEPVVITCTGATASRNYIPGLTEAYYRKLPLLALTYSQHLGRVGNYTAQVIDRSSPFVDMCKKSVSLPMVYTEEDKQTTITVINDLLLELTHDVCGPCHINMVTAYSNDFSITKLPECRIIQRHYLDNMPPLLDGKIGIFIGAHSPFTTEETKAIDAFCETNDAIVIADHVGNYHGKYKFRSNLIGSQGQDFGLKHFDLVIYIGYVHGAYLPFSSTALWRVNQDGIIRDPFKNITKVFEMKEIDFFQYYSHGDKKNTLLGLAQNAKIKIEAKIPDLPFSNMWIAKETAKLLPPNSVLHLSILNSLRVWNYFDIDDSIDCFTNSGGYGIDGCLSTFLGSALDNKEREHYLVIGDLSFFYDFDTLFNSIPSNVHILLVNNGIGTEFKNYNHRAARFGEEANAYIAAKGHNGFKNPYLVKSLCQDNKILYLTANNKESYLKVRNEWLKKHDAPVLLEVFTNDKDESDALKKMNNIFPDNSFKSILKRSVVGKVVKRILRGR